MLTSLTPTSSHKEQQAPSPLAGDKQLFELIDSKFNQLARKILDELKHGQQSQNFCQAIDAALQELPLATRAPKITRQRQVAAKQGSSPTRDQPRSLPVEARSSSSQAYIKSAPSKRHPHNESHSIAVYPISKSATTGHQVSKRTDRDRGGLGVFASSITTHPLLANAQVAGEQVHNTSRGRGPNDHSDCSQRGRNECDYDDDDLDASNDANQDDVDDVGDEDDSDDGDDSDDNDDDDDDESDPFQESSRSEHCQSPWDASIQAAKSVPTRMNPVINSRTYSEVKHVTESNNNNIRTPKQQTYFKPQTVQQIVQKHQQIQQHHNQHQSLPASNTPSSQQQLQTRQQVQQQKQHSSNNGKQRFNPISRSNTLGSVGKQFKFQSQQQASKQRLASEDSGHPMATATNASVEQAKPVMMLNKRDIGSLYKPHMNYSTSVLGNHRLSDDDEIIIIPTQSPSVMSTSPDMSECQANRTDAAAGQANSLIQSGPDDATERFSISRTKSFWEKLSKGRAGQRIGSEPSSSADTDCLQSAAGGGKQAANCLANNQYQFNVHGFTFSDRISSLKSSKGNGGKKLDCSKQTTNVGRQAHNLDRMDSTGGSNSNYSCSSSGDENSGSHSQHNPVIGQIQEMSRQNRFRQTR